MSEDIKPLGVKAPLHLLPFKPLCAIAAAMQHGAIKYAPWNWQDNSHMADRTDELYGALMRHTLAASDPSQDSHDEESGLHHLAHAGACVLILLFKLGVGYVPSKFVDAELLEPPKGAPYPLGHPNYNPPGVASKPLQQEVFSKPLRPLPIKNSPLRDHLVDDPTTLDYNDWRAMKRLNATPETLARWSAALRKGTTGG